MKKVKRFNSEFRGMIERPNGQFVFEADFYKLKEHRDALAAENAALKDINAWCHTEAFQNMHREFKTAEAIGCPDVDCMHDAMLVAIMHAPETPATDAFLNSVRAEGVELVKAHPAISLCSLTHVCEEIAAKLRAGKDGE